MPDAERERLAAMGRLDDPVREGAWYRWGPYLSERAWGTVREDYSANGDAWNSLPHEHARSRAYRWNEDGMAGVSDDHGLLCLALSLWNGADPILKSRMFGLTGPEGNHGEDAKELWWYLDALPSHAWLRWRYHYPQAAFPYDDLVATNAARTRTDPEYELLDTGVFDDDRYWVVEVSYAKADPTDLLMRIRARNMGPDAAELHVLPTLWFRNTWAWGRDDGMSKPRLRVVDGAVEATLSGLGRYRLAAAVTSGGSTPTWLVCENETNAPRLFGSPSRTPCPKDGIDDHVIGGRPTVSPALEGTKAAAWYRVTAQPGETIEIRLRLTALEDEHGTPVERPPATDRLGSGFASVMATREAEADAFFAGLTPEDASADEALVLRQAIAGMIWGKQFYHYNVADWLDGDPAGPPPPPERLHGRNARWRHLEAADVISMPDPWEYPWFAAWDLAFHAVTLAHVDAAFAKNQLLLLCRERYMHPDGQLPAYEWDFSDVNPPVHAWAALRVFEIDGGGDRAFLERVFHKLLIDYTWWVNREDPDGTDLFGGGFLGLDNISPIDRSHLPAGTRLEEADGTGWMAAFSLWMLEIALELSRHDPVYEGLALTFLDHFAGIAMAINDHGLWDEAGGYFYDRLVLPDGQTREVTARSIAGLVPLIAGARIRVDELYGTPHSSRPGGGLVERLGRHRDWPGKLVHSSGETMAVLGVVDRDRLRRLLATMLDRGTFLSDHGLRSLSARLRAEPFRLQVDGATVSVDYEPAESTTAMFGGNSNWRGPVWFPLNTLIVEALRGYGQVLGDELTVEYPVGSGHRSSLDAIADDLAHRLLALFLPGPDGARPINGGSTRYRDDPAWRELITFNEYFDGDTGKGLGASHQTGWTGLVAHLILSRSATGTARPPSGSGE